MVAVVVVVAVVSYEVRILVGKDDYGGKGLRLASPLRRDGGTTEEATENYEE